MRKLFFLTGLIFLSAMIGLSSCEKEEEEKDVIIEGVPTLITGATCEVHQQSTLISGECTDEGYSAVTVKGMVWNTSSEPTLENKLYFSNHGPGIGAFKSSLSNLTPNTTYYFRAYATNTQGTGYGKVESFKTPAK